MVNIIVKGRKGIEEIECESCGSILEYDRFTDVETNEYKEPFIRCPLCEKTIALLK